MKKIMFNEKYGLTTAVQRGLKTKTRRLVPDDTPVGNWEETLAKAHFKVGEIVAIAQSYRDVGFEPDMLKTTYVKGIGWVDMPISELPGWKNKMFTCADMMPLRIRITDVSMERLQDITDEDCLKEGVQEVCVNNNWGNSATHWEYRIPYEDSLGRTKLLRGATPRKVFAILIDRVAGRGTWESNPYVFVYTFEVLK